MGPFVICKVTGIYSQRVTVEDPDGLSGQDRWVWPRTVYVRIWTLRTLSKGKVVVKVSLRWPMGAGLMLQDLAFLVLWVWVKTS